MFALNVKGSQNSHKGKSMEQSIIEMDLSEVKKCLYEGCRNTIPSSSDFNHCEVCRTLIMHKSMVLLLDPRSPHPRNAVELGKVHDRLLTSMSGDEALRFVNNLEEVYLNMQRFVKLHGITSTTSKVKKSVADAIEEAQGLENTPKTRAKHQRIAEVKTKNREGRLAQKLGGDLETAKKLLGETFDL